MVWAPVMFTLGFGVQACTCWSLSFYSHNFIFVYGLLIYVDDIVLVGDHKEELTHLKQILDSNLVFWNSFWVLRLLTPPQEANARSSSEAEYRALASATCELQWLQYILTDLQIECNKTLVLYCDIRRALHIAANPVFHERTKHPWDWLSCSKREINQWSNEAFPSVICLSNC